VSKFDIPSGWAIDDICTGLSGGGDEIPADLPRTDAGYSEGVFVRLVRKAALGKGGLNDCDTCHGAGITLEDAIERALAATMQQITLEREQPWGFSYAPS